MMEVQFYPGLPHVYSDTDCGSINVQQAQQTDQYTCHRIWAMLVWKSNYIACAIDSDLDSKCVEHLGHLQCRGLTKWSSDEACACVYNIVINYV